MELFNIQVTTPRSEFNRWNAQVEATDWKEAVLKLADELVEREKDKQSAQEPASEPAERDDLYELRAAFGDLYVRMNLLEQEIRRLSTQVVLDLDKPETPKT